MCNLCEGSRLSKLLQPFNEGRIRRRYTDLHCNYAASLTPDEQLRLCFDKGLWNSRNERLHEAHSVLAHGHWHRKFQMMPRIALATHTYH